MAGLTGLVKGKERVRLHRLRTVVGMTIEESLPVLLCHRRRPEYVKVLATLLCPFTLAGRGQRFGSEDVVRLDSNKSDRVPCETGCGTLPWAITVDLLVRETIVERIQGLCSAWNATKDGRLQDGFLDTSLHYHLILQREPCTRNLIHIFYVGSFTCCCEARRL